MAYVAFVIDILTKLTLKTMAQQALKLPIAVMTYSPKHSSESTKESPGIIHTYGVILMYLSPKFAQTCFYTPCTSSSTCLEQSEPVQIERLCLVSARSHTAVTSRTTTPSTCYSACFMQAWSRLAFLLVM